MFFLWETFDMKQNNQTGTRRIQTIWFCAECIGKMIVDLDDYER